MLISRRTVKVEWGSCDPAKIVFFPRYFEWFDASTANHFETFGLPKPELIRKFNVIGFPVVDVRAQFYAPCRYGDVVNIETQITDFGRSRFEVRHKLLMQESLHVEGFETRVLVGVQDDETLRSVRIPGEIRQLFTD